MALFAAIKSRSAVTTADLSVVSNGQLSETGETTCRFAWRNARSEARKSECHHRLTGRDSTRNGKHGIRFLCAENWRAAVAGYPGQVVMRRISIHWRRLLFAGRVPVRLNYLSCARRLWRSESTAGATPQKVERLADGARARGVAKLICRRYICKRHLPDWRLRCHQEAGNKVMVLRYSVSAITSAGSGRNSQSAHQIRAPPPGDSAALKPL